MPLMVLDVPKPAWNEVMLQATLFGLSVCPESNSPNPSTVVEVTGTWEKLNAVLSRVSKRVNVDLLAVMESKVIDQCR